MKKKKQEKTIKNTNEKGDIIWMKGMEDIINLSIDDNINNNNNEEIKKKLDKLSINKDNNNSDNQNKRGIFI